MRQRFAFGLREITSLAKNEGIWPRSQPLQFKLQGANFAINKPSGALFSRRVHEDSRKVHEGPKKAHVDSKIVQESINKPESSRAYVLYTLLTLGFCVAYTLYHLRTDDSTATSMAKTIQHKMYDNKLSNKISTKSYPDLAAGLTMLYGFDIVSYLIQALNALDFSQESVFGEVPESISKQVSNLRAKIKDEIRELLMSRDMSVPVEESISDLLNSAASVISSDEPLDLSALNKEFAKINWQNYKPGDYILKKDSVDMLKKKAMYIYYDGQVLKREVEHILLGIK